MLASTTAAQLQSLKNWSNLINQCTASFPHSSIKMSSIVPARGRHHLNNFIFPSNRNLQAVCQHLNVACIDHTSTFTTDTGAPRLALYWNVTHPSDKGTARLASNMRSVFINAGRDRTTGNGPREAGQTTTFQRNFYDRSRHPSFPVQDVHFDNRPRHDHRLSQRNSSQENLLPSQTMPRDDTISCPPYSSLLHFPNLPSKVQNSVTNITPPVTTHQPNVFMEQRPRSRSPEPSRFFRDFPQHSSFSHSSDATNQIPATHFPAHPHPSLVTSTLML